MNSQYAANTTSFFQAAFTHDLRSDDYGTAVIEQTERWGIANQSDPKSTAADRYKFNFNIDFDLG